MEKKKINAQLILKHSATWAQRFQLVDKRYINIQERKGKDRVDFTVDLVAVDANRKYSFSLNWAVLVISLVCFAAGGAVFAGMVALPDLGVDKQLIAIGLLVLGAVLDVVVIKSMRFNTVYRAALSHVPVIVMPRGVFMSAQDKKDMEGFVKRINHYMQKAKEHFNFQDDDQKAGEIRMLRRLSEQGVVSKAHYEASKKVILGNKLRAA